MEKLHENGFPTSQQTHRFCSYKDQPPANHPRIRKCAMIFRCEFRIHNF